MMILYLTVNMKTFTIKKSSYFFGGGALSSIKIIILFITVKKKNQKKTWKDKLQLSKFYRLFFSLFNSQHQICEVNCFWILLYQMSAILLITEQATFELNSSVSLWGMWLLIEHRCNGWYTVTRSDVNLRSLLK